VNRIPRRGAFAAIAGLGVAALALTGCVASERDDGEDVDGTFVFAASSDPASLDPAFTNDGESFRVARQMFEGLVGTEPGTADPAPLLAESWDVSDDGLSYTFHLKEGVVFHDDTPFDAEAVCYNFDRWYNFTGVAQSQALTYYYSALFKGFADTGTSIYVSCSADDAATATVTLNQQYAGFIAALSLPAFAMQSPTALEEFAADEVGGTDEAPELTEYGSAHPTGTGPYEFVSWEPGNQVEMTAFEGYWGEAGDVTDIIIRTIDDPVAARQSLEAGDIDGYDNVPAADTASLEDDGFTVTPRPPFTILYLGINQATPELADVRVRQAISMAIDKEQLIQQILPEGTEVATQFMPPVVIGWSDEVTTYDYDPEAAQALLAEAGYPDGFTVQFNYPTGVSRPYMPNPEEIFTNVSSQLEAIGITIDPQPNVWNPDYLDRIQASSNHGLHLLGWTGDYNDPDNFVGTFFGGAQDEWGFDNPDLFAALTEARGLTDPDEQQAAYAAINATIAEFIPGVPLAHPAPSLAFAPRVASYPVSPVNDEVFSLIELTE
jgi:peptide/nickel transport system substrate-binding protein